MFINIQIKALNTSQSTKHSCDHKTFINLHWRNVNCSWKIKKIQVLIFIMFTYTRQPWMRQREQSHSSQRRRSAANTYSCSTNASMGNSYHKVDTSQNRQLHLCHIFLYCSIHSMNHHAFTNHHHIHNLVWWHLITRHLITWQIHTAYATPIVSLLMLSQTSLSCRPW